MPTLLKISGQLKFPICYGVAFCNHNLKAVKTIEGVTSQAPSSCPASLFLNLHCLW